MLVLEYSAIRLAKTDTKRRGKASKKLTIAS
jgi:hypothetical protein